MSIEINEENNNQISEDIIDEINEDYLFYKSLVPDLTLLSFTQQNELHIKEMFEYDPCIHEDLYYDY